MLIYITYDVIHTMGIYVDESINANVQINAHTPGPDIYMLVAI